MPHRFFPSLKRIFSPKEENSNNKAADLRPSPSQKQNSANEVAAKNEQILAKEQKPVGQLWNIAYINFKDACGDNKELVERYEQLLPELTGQPSGPGKSSSDQLQLVINDGIKKQDEKEIKVHIWGLDKDVNLSEGASKLAKWTVFLKDFVADAVKASPEASMAWAGVCLVIPILTIPETAKQANAAGLTEVTLRMDYYVKLEALLLPQTRDIKSAALDRFKTNLEKLYQHVIEFQIKCALRYQESRRRRLWNEFFNSEDWTGMVDAIKDLDKRLTEQLETMTRHEIKLELEGISEKATQSYETQCQIVKELGDMKDILWEIAQNTKPPLNIPSVPEAFFDSRTNEIRTKDVEAITSCHEGTRVHLLEQVSAWAKDPDGKTVLWLHGPDGVGKSTIAYTVASALQKDHHLAASYFFRRGHANRNDATLFFPTLSCQLVRTIPEFGLFLEESLTASGSIGVSQDTIKSANLRKQFETIIRDPLKNISQSASDAAAHVIVIDALDECEGSAQEDDIVTICQLLLELHEIKGLRLRVFVTSKKENFIDKLFGGDSKHARVINILEREFDNEAKDDISKYLAEKFKNIRAKRRISEVWPDTVTFDNLVRLATDPYPLFIYASTLCRFVDDGEHFPKRQLQSWLSNSSNASHLGKVFKPSISQLVSGYKSDIPLLSQVLGSLIFLAVPLPARVTATLLGIDPDEIDFIFQKLHAVLRIPDDPKFPVEILHNSFRNYLLGKEVAEDFGIQIDVKEDHKKLLSKCLGYIRVADAEEGAESLSSAAMEYACMRWEYHFAWKGAVISKGDDTFAFLGSHFPKWLKFLSQRGQLSKGSDLLKTLAWAGVAADAKQDVDSYLHNARESTGIFFALDSLPAAIVAVKENRIGLKPPETVEAVHVNLTSILQKTRILFEHLGSSIPTPSELLDTSKSFGIGDFDHRAIIGYLSSIGRTVELTLRLLGVDSRGEPDPKSLPSVLSMDIQAINVWSEMLDGDVNQTLENILSYVDEIIQHLESNRVQHVESRD